MGGALEAERTRRLHVLGLAREASPMQVRRACRLLARRWHPDRFTDAWERERAEEEMRRINAAHAWLQEHPPPGASSLREARSGRRADDREAEAAPAPPREQSTSLGPGLTDPELRIEGWKRLAWGWSTERVLPWLVAAGMSSRSAQDLVEKWLAEERSERRVRRAMLVIAAVSIGLIAASKYGLPGGRLPVALALLVPLVLLSLSGVRGASPFVRLAAVGSGERDRLRIGRIAVVLIAWTCFLFLPLRDFTWGVTAYGLGLLGWLWVLCRHFASRMGPE